MKKKGINFEGLNLEFERLVKMLSKKWVKRNPDGLPKTFENIVRINKLLPKKYQFPRKETIKLTDHKRKVRDDINNMLFNGTLELERVSVCRCGCNDYFLIANVDGFGIWTPTVICDRCGLLRSLFRLDEESMDLFYENYYYDLHVGESTLNEDYEFKKNIAGQKIFDFVRTHTLLKSGDKVLEIGCGSGGILGKFKEEGFEVYGLEVDSSCIELGKEHGIPIRNGFADEVDTIFNDFFNGFDLIIFSHVLEHLRNPDRIIEKIRSLTNHNGFVYIEVPSVLGIKRHFEGNLLRYLQFAHIYHFSLGTLKNMLEDHSFKLMHGDEYVHAIFKESLILETDIADNYSIIKKYLDKLDEPHYVLFFWCYHQVKRMYYWSITIMNYLNFGFIVRGMRKIISKILNKVLK